MACHASVLVVNFDVTVFDADINGVLAVVVSNSFAIAAYLDLFAAAGRDADLNGDTGRTRATAVKIFVVAGILNVHDLLDSTR